MRDLRIVESPEEVVPAAAKWSLLPPDPVAIWYLDLDDRASDTHCFKVLECDGPNITNYSACFVDEDLVYLHAHRSSEDLSFYREGGGDRLFAMWLYYPVEQSERIIEVWRLKRRPKSSHDISVPEAMWERVTSFNGLQPSRFWFSSHGDSVDCLAFDSEDKRHEKTEAPRVRDPSIWSSRRDSHLIISTSARLVGVTEVVPCRAWAPGSSGIVRLIFTYSDGHKESVGQVRLDHLLPPNEAEPTGDMWLGARALPSGGGIVESMRLIPGSSQTIHGGAPNQADLNWARTAWRGRVHWDFRYRQCFVRSNEQSNALGYISISTLLESWAGREREKEEAQGQLIVPGR
ncbi:hypothetical protein FBEOM_7398 [Fusarium beomiforme]|uniref:Uncharacterized protein n=1 Tax=Fusarium beomiforme TaxID=44412 RepID=A0A9P5AIV7_9HYPO|nr:hypothetical protein FBEOM_7398 [Fusarium beomiforme]